MERGTSARLGQRNLVTGANGFVGRYLVDALLAEGEHVIALTRGTAPAWKSPAESRVCDLVDGDLRSMLRETRPTRIYHLAGFSDAGASVREPEAAYRDNTIATDRLLTILRELDLRPRIVHVSSGLVYGRPGNDAEPLHEGSPLQPETPYAESKALADQAVERFGQETGIEILRARPFNHTGPGQSPHFAIPGFAQRIGLIAAGIEPPVLKTGNLDVERDISDVRDVVAAYLLLMQRGIPGEAYNIASGTSVSMREIVRKMIDLAGVEVELRTSPDLVRPGEALRVRVSVNKLERLGWTRRFSLDAT